MELLEDFGGNFDVVVEPATETGVDGAEPGGNETDGEVAAFLVVVVDECGTVAPETPVCRVVGGSVCGTVPRVVEVVLSLIHI